MPQKFPRQAGSLKISFQILNSRHNSSWFRLVSGPHELTKMVWSGAAPYTRSYESTNLQGYVDSDSFHPFETDGGNVGPMASSSYEGHQRIFLRHSCDVHVCMAERRCNVELVI